MICSPGGIRGERTSATTALLTWDEPYTRCVYCPYNASGYEVMAEGIATITVSRPPCVINGLNPNQEYFFYLYAKAAGNIRSNPSRARIGRYVPDRTPPSKPTELRTESVVGNRVDLAWVASVDNGGVVGYQIFCDGKLIGNTDSTRYAVADLNDATTYIFMVRAQDPDGNHADSDPLMVTIPDLGGPTTPGSFRVIAAITHDTISVGWLPSYGDARMAYEIFVDTVYLATTGNTYRRIEGLRPGTTYSFSVRAVNTLGKRSGSTTIQATTTAAR
ncbi:hypothetical protein PspS04_12720 [Pseudomonas sp. S04]|uniref:fibronectin type III domain-containing protein n=1 Tax=unclassified Pseudomonas TaxID=196821 RepID=UPI00131F8B29|nr:MULTISPECIES: fibronectin type III domain-containing protein [unclassified Pseudomonas]QHD01167.1 hypothetical protein PspS04_12720 [Pseudomonas sp. S04]QHF33651.1 hypothetical protein PspS19_12725 [Pseudomonas sp. S19]